MYEDILKELSEPGVLRVGVNLGLGIGLASR